VKIAPAAGEKRKARGNQQMPGVSLSDATLKAVQAHSEGATASDATVRSGTHRVRAHHRNTLNR